MLDDNVCDYCSYTNFLLIVCQSCKKSFCENHIRTEIHNCQQSHCLRQKCNNLSKNFSKYKCFYEDCKNHSTIECLTCQRYICGFHLAKHAD